MTLALALILAALLGTPRAAAGLSACTAAQIVAQDSGCPASGACTITKLFDIGDGCVLDFGARNVTLGGNAELDVGSGTMTLRAANLTLAGGALIDARGQSSAPRNEGGSVSVITSGNVSIQKAGSTRARIDASGDVLGGDILIDAGGSVDLSGHLYASHFTPNGNGGNIRVFAGGDITSAVGTEITATGGSLALSGGGRVEMNANGKIDLGDLVDVTGAGGGVIDLDARGTMIVRTLRGIGNGDVGPGGTVTLTSWRDMQILGQILLRGSEYTPDAGGEGGSLTIDVAYGDLTVADDVFAEGGGPDGDGGEISIIVNGAITTTSGGSISARCNGIFGFGGLIEMVSSSNLTVGELIDASGGGGGGEVSIDASGNVVINDIVDARGRSDEGVGGEISIVAGSEGAGSMSVQSDVDASGGPCSLFGCGDGGFLDLFACNVTVTATGRALARAPGAGGIVGITAREQLRVDGTVSAARTLASGVDGTVGFIHPATKPPILRVGGVAPSPGLSPKAVCGPGSMDCLTPCPTCGNGSIEFPEACDDGNTSGCDACSRFCAVQSCDPAGLCATACNPLLGCPPLPPVPCAASPTATATSAPPTTAPPSSTPTRTSTPLPGAPTFSPTYSPTVTSTPSFSPTPTHTNTATLTPTRTSSPTPSRTATATTTWSPTPTPVSRYDAVVSLLRAVTLDMKDGQAAEKVVKIRVTNGAVDLTERPIRLQADLGDCPLGVVAALPDFEPLNGGAQDTVLLKGGRSAFAQVLLRADPLVFQPLNRRSPQRCTLFVHAEVAVGGNQDPSPENNLATLEVNVLDDVTRIVSAHQTSVSSAPPVTVRFRRGKTVLVRKTRVVVNNADRNDVAGHAVTLVASDGDCPTGTVGTPVFHKPSAIPVNNVAVQNMRSRAASVPISVHAADFPAGTRKSPRRCTALLLGSGPSGDLDASNDVILLPIDVITQ